MYVYDEFDRTLVDERVREFRDQVARRLSGELTEEEFKPLRLMNGVYLQLHAYMLRIAIPYGTLSTAQLRTLAHVARQHVGRHGRVGVAEVRLGVDVVDRGGDVVAQGAYRRASRPVSAL